MPPDLYYLDAVELARRIRSKEISPVEVLRRYRERIDAVNPAVNAIVTVVDDAEAAAREAESAVMRGEALGPLHGVPFTVKDSLDTSGLRTTRGSRLFAEHIPSVDAIAVARLKTAGGIVLAKTNVPEFSFARETANPLFGRTLNPWNCDRTPGGSSGGEAAAIAAGLSPIGVGSDVAISIRGPAHFCGIVGLKATHGRIPLTGHWPETLRRYWHVGPLARTVPDVALAFTVMAGPDGHDPYAVAIPPANLSTLESGVRGLRVGWITEHTFGACAREVADTVARAAKCLQEMGCDVEHLTVPGLQRRNCDTLSMTLFAAEAKPYLKSVVSGREAALSATMQRWLSSATSRLDDYVTAEAEVEGLRHDLMECFRYYDVLLCPVVPVAAFPHEAAQLTIEGSTLPSRHVVRTTAPFNLSGSPALSVPFGWNSEGLPIGVQVVGRHFDEATILRIGAALEMLHDAVRRHPIP